MSKNTKAPFFPRSFFLIYSWHNICLFNRVLSLLKCGGFDTYLFLIFLKAWEQSRYMKCLILSVWSTKIAQRKKTPVRLLDTWRPSPSSRLSHSIILVTLANPPSQHHEQIISNCKCVCVLKGRGLPRWIECPSPHQVALPLPPPPHWAGVWFWQRPLC